MQKKAISPEKAEAAQRFGINLIQLYLLGYSDTAVSELLGLPKKGGIWGCLNGRRALRAMRVFNQRLDEVISQVMEINFPVPANNPSLGVKTKTGVTHVLQKIMPTPLNESAIGPIVVRTARIAHILRAHLNLLTQVESSRGREIAIHELLPQLEELAMAIRAFSARHPSEVLTMNSSTRAILARTQHRRKK